MNDDKRFEDMLSATHAEALPVGMEFVAGIQQLARGLRDLLSIVETPKVFNNHAIEHMVEYATKALRQYEHVQTWKYYGLDSDCIRWMLMVLRQEGAREPITVQTIRELNLVSMNNVLRTLHSSERAILEKVNARKVAAYESVLSVLAQLGDTATHGNVSTLAKQALSIDFNIGLGVPNAG